MKRVHRAALRLLAVCLWLSACGPVVFPLPGDVAPTPQGATPTPDRPAPTPTPPPKTLTVCMASEPASLYLYGPAEMAKAHVLEAIAEGPIDWQDFEARPVLLQTLPSLANGDLRVSAVPVGNGQTVVDAFGNVTTLARGVLMWALDDATGLPASEPVEFTGAGSLNAVQLQATFRMKPGLQWSDGEALTAGDSVFSFDVAGSPETPTGKYRVLRSESYTATDSTTVTWTGLPGWLDTHPEENFWTPLPRHAYGSMAPGEMLASEPVNRSPLGWGAFRVEAWVDGEYIRVVRNPYYHRAGEGLPRFDQIVFRFVDDPKAALAELLEGGCDVATQDGAWSSALDAVLDAARGGRLRAQFAPGAQLEHLDFNLSPAEGHAGVVAEGLFADARVRQAFAHCIDRQSIVNDVWGGRAEVPDAYLSSSHPLFSRESVQTYAFDPERGRALLEESGWAVGDDGVRVKDGQRLSLDYAINSPQDPAARQVRSEAAARVRQQLKDNCDIETELVLLDSEAMYGRWPQGRVFGRQFDLAEFAWSVAGLDPICDVYLSTAVPGNANVAGVNNTGYANPEFDAACLASLRALDADARREAGARALSIFTAELPSLPLYLDLRVMLARPQVMGLQLLPGGASELWMIEEVDSS